MKKFKLLALILCFAVTCSLAVVTAFADRSVNYTQTQVLKGLSTENISVTDKNGNEVQLASGPHGGSADKSVLVDGVIHSTQTTRLVDAEGNGVVGYVTIDAGQEYVVNKLLIDIVHDWGATDFTVELSSTADFTNSTLIYSNVSGNNFTADKNVPVAGVLFNTQMQGVTFNFSPVKARYIRIGGNTFGNGSNQGYTCLGEVQMFAVTDTVTVYSSALSGTYENELTVTLGSLSENAEIYYTTDGSVPTKSSTKYEESLTLTKSTNLRAVAYVGDTNGYPFDFNYTIVSNDSYDVDVNYAQGKKVTAYDMSGNELFWTAHGGGTSLDAAVDGVMGTSNSFALANAEGATAVGFVQVDMGKSVWIDQVNLTLWHDWVFRAITIQISDSADFSTFTTILCTDHVGWVIPKDWGWAGSLDSNFDYTAYEWFPHSGNGWTFNFAPIKGRYIRTLNQAGQGYTVLTEIQAITCEAPEEIPSYEVGVNYTQGKPVTAYDTAGNELFWMAHNGGTSLDAAVDGVMGTDNSFGLQDKDGNAAVGWIQVDMGKSVWIDKVNLTLWHNWVFRAITIQISDSADFSTFKTIVCTDIGSWWVSNSLAGSLDSNFDYDAQEWVPHSGNGWTFNFAPVKGRYIRTLNQAGNGKYNTVLTEIQAITCEEPASLPAYEVGVNYAQGKTVTAYDFSGNELFWTAHGGGTSLGAAVDGVMGTSNSFALANKEGATAVGFVQVDMGQTVWINKINLTLWHDWVFRAITIQISDDEDFETFTTIVCTDHVGWVIPKDWGWAGSLDPNFDYTEYEWFPHSGNGWTFNFAPVKGRYIRTLNQAGQGYTVLTEIQAFTCADPYAVEEDEEEKYEYENFVTEVKEVNGLNVYAGKDVAELGLPETITVKYSDGITANLDVTWSCENYDKFVAGEYTFVANVSDALDVYGLLENVTVKVTVVELNLTALNTVLAQAGEINLDLYTASTATAVTNAKTEAENVLAKEYKTQDEVNAIATRLENAIKALAERAVAEDYLALQTQVDRIATAIADENRVTNSCLATAKTLLQNANAYLNAEESAKAEFTATEVNSLINELTAFVVAYKADVTALTTLFNECVTTYGYSEEDTNGYHIEGYCEYLDVMYIVENVLEEGDLENISQEEIDGYKANLETAVAGLVRHADVTALLAKVEEYSNLVAETYTVSSFIAFSEVLEQVKVVAEKPANYLLQDEVDQTLETLENAFASLAVLGDTSNLKQLIALASVEEASDYTTASFQALVDALYNANQIKNSNDVTQAQVQEVETALQSAYEGLVKIGDKTELVALLDTAKNYNTDNMTEEEKADFQTAIDYAQAIVDFEGEVTLEQVNSAIELLSGLMSDNDSSSSNAGCSLSVGSLGFIAIILMAFVVIRLKRKEKMNEQN